MTQRRAVALIAILSAIYCALNAKSYVLSALGMNPQLDAAEMIRLAAMMAAGDLPAEPFYRAPGFAMLLAVMLKLGAQVAALPLLAALLNVALHLLSLVLIERICHALGAPLPQRLAAMGLYGLYPLAAYFVAEPMDITLAITLMLLGVWSCLKAAQCHHQQTYRPLLERSAYGPKIGLSETPAVPDGPSPLPWIIAMGLAFGFATWARPQLLLVGLMAAGWLYWQLRHELIARLVLGAALLLPLLLMGWINSAISGEFRILPWQGSYALYAANGADADPRWYSQVRSLRALAPGENPARVESFERFEEITGERARSIDALNHFWQSRMLQQIFDRPGDFFHLLRKRAFYALNNVEQYNNKTYAWQSERFALLHFNPIGFWLVLTLGVAGFACTWRDRNRQLLALLTVAAFATLLIAWPSDRFRLPMVPLLLCLATGLSLQKDRWLPLLWAIPALVLALWPIPRAEREVTFGNDALLWGNAHAGRGELNQARAFYRQAATLNETARAGDALCRLNFNAWLLDSPQQAPGWPNTTDVSDCAQAAQGGALEAQFILALAQLKRGDRSAAIAALQRVRLGKSDRLRGRAIVAEALMQGSDLAALASELAEIRLSPDPTVWVALQDPRAAALPKAEIAAATKLWAAFAPLNPTP